MAVVCGVSIRALRAGRMEPFTPSRQQQPVSIRALRAGRMNSDSGDRADFPGFQSAPCVQGEWKYISYIAVNAPGFQSAPCVQGE